MPLDTYEWTKIKPEDCVHGGSRMVGHYYCHLENMTIYRKPGKRPMYFAAVYYPIYFRSKNHPTIEAAMSNLNQQLSAHKGGE